MCELAASLEDDTIAYRDDTWTVGIAVDVPGWLMLFTNDTSRASMVSTTTSAASFGRLAAGLARAITDVCSAERGYPCTRASTPRTSMP